MSAQLITVLPSRIAMSRAFLAVYPVQSSEAVATWTDAVMPVVHSRQM
jgi:chromate transport protein ChrA